MKRTYLIERRMMSMASVCTSFRFIWSSRQAEMRTATRQRPPPPSCPLDRKPWCCKTVRLWRPVLSTLKVIATHSYHSSTWSWSTYYLICQKDNKTNINKLCPSLGFARSIVNESLTGESTARFSEANELNIYIYILNDTLSSDNSVIPDSW